MRAAPFNPTSYYEGELALGGAIKFLGEDPETGVSEGMLSRIAKLDEPRYNSFEHIGFMKNGVEDTGSEEVKKWRPAFENYTF